LKINVLTPYRIGGPYNWGKDLVHQINSATKHNSSHIHELRKLVLSPLINDSDLVHSVVPLSYKTWKKPVILTMHGDVLTENNIWKFFYQSALKKADIITSPSYYLKNRLAIDECIVIPNAIFSNRYNPVLHSEKKCLNIVTLTKFYFKDKSEGVLKILSILDKISNLVDYEINYTVVGGGYYLDYIKKESEKYQTHVTFTGMIENSAKILETCDLFLYYSMHDNFPISILEAMACGLPVVSNNVGAINEEIIDAYNGFIVKDDESYKDKVLELINNFNLRLKIGNNARNSVKTTFDWNVVIGKYIELYEKLVN
jgi:glycosyltransferase involved in cell wall biosynthesis